MCTLTYLPYNDGYILTSNRDESIKRAEAQPPAKRNFKGQSLYYPKDPEGGGSWIAVSPNGRAGVILNGAFERHQPEPPYSMSRGLILLEAITSSNIDTFLKESNFENIEPFTLVICSDQSKQVLELKWEGQQRFIQSFDAFTPKVWSAPMLYPKEVRQKTVENFENFLVENKLPRTEDLMLFNESEGYKEKMKWHGLAQIPELYTLSTSQVFLSGNEIRFVYHDLRKDEVSIVSLTKLRI